MASESESTASFRRYIESKIAQQYGTAQNLASKIGLSVSAFLRGVKIGTLGLDTLFRLAYEFGDPPGKMLRLAGKGDVADLLDRLYGPTREDARSLTGSQREILTIWTELDSAEREPLLLLFRALHAKKKKRHKTA